MNHWLTPGHGLVKMDILVNYKGHIILAIFQIHLRLFHEHYPDFLPNVPDDTFFLDWHCPYSLYRTAPSHCTLWATHHR